MNVPLSEELRPRLLADVVGQDHLVGPEGFLTRIIEGGNPLSLLLWGPPGCGKTTIAKLYAQAFQARFVSLSAVFSGVADLKKVIAEAESAPLFHRRTILFVDEIHRFNKAQQDAFLPYVEKGTLTLVGATTENPSFSLVGALLSRLRVVTLSPLSEAALEAVLKRYEQCRSPLPLTEEARAWLVSLAQGDGRFLLNLVENLESVRVEKELDIAALEPIVQRRAALYDKSGDGHYNLISALHKAIRGSDADAALYWFARMLEGGEDPLFIARRLIRMATEDIGLADPEALSLAMAARESYAVLGSPEGELGLAEVVLYLALAPKSNALYMAYKRAREVAGKTTHVPPSKMSLNAPTKLMKEEGYGQGYLYDHDTPEGCSGQSYFPQGVPRQILYDPVERGFEREMKKRLAYFNSFRKNPGKDV